MVQNKLIEKGKILKVWQKCLVTFLVLVTYRILCTIPTPGVNKDFINMIINSNATFGLLNTFSGNNLSSLSIMALNITPYISATIVIQLLQPSIEPLRRMARGTPKEKKRVAMLTYGLTAIFAVSQSVGMAIAFGRDGLLVEYSALWIVIIISIWTSAAVLLAVIGKKMEDNKNIFVGRGISLILLTNILSTFPADIIAMYNTFIKDNTYEVIWCIFGVIVLFALFTLIAFLCETEKRIVVSYSSNVVYESIGSSNLKQILPIKLMPASVMPVIFTSTLLSIPVLIASFTGHSEVEWIKYINMNCWFNPENMIYSLGCILYIVLVFAFSFVYVSAFMSPYEIAEDLQKAGGFINNLKTNTDVAKYLKKHIYQMAFFGAIVLSAVSVAPFILSGVFGLSQMSFLGTSVLIVVSVIIETYKDIMATKIMEDHAKMRGGLFNV